ncbi:MAG TPA: MFS transporter [Firmicutes bacterium]|nr:MFS transporter [Bacillota bacterium]
MEGWKSWIVFAIGFVIYGIASTISGPLLPLIRLDYHLSLSLAGSLFSVQFTGFILSVLIGGVMADIWGKRTFIIVGVLVLTCGLALIGCFFNRWLLATGFFMMGIGFGSFDAGLSPLFGDINSARRPFALNLLHMFFGVGALLGPFWAGHFAEGPGTWRRAYLMAAMCVLGFFIMFSSRPILRYSQGRKALFKHFTMLLTNKSLVLLAVIMGIYVGLESGINGWTFSFMTGVLRTTPRLGTLTVSLFWVSLTLGRLLVAYLSERLNHRLLILLCCLGSLLASVPGVMGLGVHSTVISFIALGFFLSGVVPMVMAQGMSCFPHLTSSAAGILMAAGSTGGAVVPWLIGIVADIHGLRNGMAVIPLGCALMVALSLLNIQSLHSSNVDVRS